MNISTRSESTLTNDRGTAMVIALLLLLIVILFGSIGITMSTRELRGAGDKRVRDQRFYEAQTGITETLLKSKDWMTDSFLTTPAVDIEHPVIVYDPSNPGKPLANLKIWAIQNDNPTLAQGRVLPVQPHITEPTVGSGYSMGKFQVRRYSITSTTPDNNTQLREGVWRAFNK